MSAPGERDAPHRRLTPVELDTRAATAAGLRVWSTYLNKMHTPANDIETADAERRPCALKHRANGNPYVPVVVDPLAVCDWAREQGEFVSLRRDRVAMLDVLVRALEFMGGHQVETFEPVNDPPGMRRRRRGRYWKLSQAVRMRLIGENYTPVLTPPAGRRPASAPAPLAAPRTPRATGAGARARNFDVVHVLAHLLRTCAPTALSVTAEREHRPLAVRRRGRPRTGPLVDSLRTDVLLVSARMVVEHVRTHAAVLSIAFVPTVEQADGALRALAEAQPAVVALVGGLRTLDAGYRRGAGEGWWRLTLAALGSEFDPDDLIGELSDWRQAAPSTRAAPATSSVELTASGHTRAYVDAAIAQLDYQDPLPAGITPEDLEPWQRDHLGYLLDIDK